MKNTKIEKLKLKKQQIQEEIKKAERREKEQARRDDVRRKILYGMALDVSVRSGKTSKESLLRILNAFITRKADREFLNLEPLADKIDET